MIHPLHKQSNNSQYGYELLMTHYALLMTV